VKCRESRSDFSERRPFFLAAVTGDESARSFTFLAVKASFWLSKH
jgi:hypothetical protein